MRGDYASDHLRPVAEQAVPQQAAAAVGAELVVLLDAAGRAVGTAPKAGVHHADTPLHLAFSCYVLDPRDRLLVTRRALGKATFPGLWTNSLCGHPAPGESLVEAVCRRAREELGLRLLPARVSLVLPGFGYRAEMDGVVEHELCPVLVARVDPEPALRRDPAEVMQTGWLSWPSFADVVLGEQPGWSPWCREQVEHLVRLGRDPRDWPLGDSARLPEAARMPEQASAPHPERPAVLSPRRPWHAAWMSENPGPGDLEQPETGEEDEGATPGSDHGMGPWSDDG